MAWLLTLLLASAAPAAPPAPAARPLSPARQMLDAFKAACSRTGSDLEPMKADTIRAGWTAVADDSHPRLARILKLGRDSVGPEAKMAGASFSRVVGGRRIFLVHSRYEDGSGYWGAGCRLYDFEATRPLDPKLLEAWMGKPPTGVQEPAPGVSKRLWEPAGWSYGITVEANHVPQNHSLGQQFGLSGNILVAQAIGGF
ncbi:MAG TPA: hypothetical protein VE891_05505 [Allosphingosinicella sp.]|nr:hypothetical protein [Allosphingosinicella sp.]